MHSFIRRNSTVVPKENQWYNKRFDRGTTMRFILLGGPGAGKGTQALKLVNYFNIPQISTGDMLRAAIAAGSELGRHAKSVMDSGKLVSDDIIIDLVKERLKQPDCRRGFLFDGFPRTIAQAEALKEASIDLDHVIEVAVPDEEIINRLSGRRVHIPSGRVYHTKFNPPIKEGIDDVTGDLLIQRDDDKEETIRKRLEVYHQQTEPVIEYYKNYEMAEPATLKFHTVSGVGSVDSVFQSILEKVMMREESCPSQ